ncbi:MAG: cobalamin biosynthesis protein CbiM [Hyphomicrobiales bacterium]|nr:cobalamin biosynthesis protein CbiM [Hyphomicrobiales bacterium]
MTLRRPLLAAPLAVAFLLAATPALAHRLKLFLATEGGEIAGRAYFVGGGRPEGVDVVFKDAAGVEVHHERTDAQGEFRWRPPAPAAWTVVVNAGDGHFVEESLAADRFGGEAATAPVVAASIAPAKTPDAGSTPACAALPGDFDARVARSVDDALARRLRPLMEAQDQAEARIRFNDVMGGVGMIVGLAGVGLWATSRRRRRSDEAPRP